MRLRACLWPSTRTEEHELETAEMLRNPDQHAVFLSVAEDGNLEGFIELQIRSYAEGCGPGPVPCIEGWYVEPHKRRQGIGRSLVEVAEQWARQRGFKEMYSDTEIENELGQEAHRRLGYRVVETIVCFRKDL